MRKRVTQIAVAVGAALSLGLAATVVEAQPYGMMGGYGSGYSSGYGMGPGMMGGYGPGYGMGPGMMGGYGPGYGMGPGMMGGYGPGYGMGPGMMGGYGPGYGMGYGMGPQAMYNAYPGAAEQRLAGLKQELGITAMQESAWQAFVNSEKKLDETRRAWFGKMHEARAAGSAPEMLAQQTEFMKQRQSELEAEATALKNLYTALTPDQKAAADQLFGGFGPGYGAGYGRGCRGGPGGRSR